MSGLSRRMSYTLRHDAGSAKSLRMDGSGWVRIDDLSGLLRTPITALLAEVETDVKRRFETSSDGSRIRASQGHSIPGVDPTLDLGSASTPPAVLYHGTGVEGANAIHASPEGILPMSRHHVHLSPSQQEAYVVANRRRGELPPVIFAVRAREMMMVGHRFFVTKNEVWLTSRVPPAFFYPVAGV